jgi:electron transport complex protein RnfG
MYRALVGIGMLCGLLIVFVYVGTLPVIKANRAAALERAVFAVLPAATSRVSFVLGPDGNFLRAADAVGERVHAGYDDAGRLVGVAIEASGMGYADTISLLYGYAPGRAAIVGMQVLASKETPGLGNKIESDPDFLANFAALDVRLDESGRAPLHVIETVKQGKKSEAWQIDGITGATVSSQAIGDILAASSKRWIPLINDRLDDLNAGVTDGSP